MPKRKVRGGGGGKGRARLGGKGRRWSGHLLLRAAASSATCARLFYRQKWHCSAGALSPALSIMAPFFFSLTIGGVCLSLDTFLIFYVFLFIYFLFYCIRFGNGCVFP